MENPTTTREIRKEISRLAVKILLAKYNGMDTFARIMRVRIHELNCKLKQIPCHE